MSALFGDDPEDIQAAVTKLVGELLGMPKKAADAALSKLRQDDITVYSLVVAELDKLKAGESQVDPKQNKQRLTPTETGLVFTWVKLKGAAFKGPLTEMARVIGKEEGFKVPVNPTMLSNMLAELGIRQKRTRPLPDTTASPVPRPSNDAIVLLIAVADRLAAAGHSLPPAATDALNRLRKVKPMGRPKNKPKNTDDGEATPV